MQSNPLLISFMVFTLLFSFAYFYMFANRQEKFIQYWGLSWIFYSISLVILVIFVELQYAPLLSIRKAFDLLNLLYLLFGAYAFMHIAVPSQWYKFTLILLVWAAIGISYGFQTTLVFLPISIYQLILTLVLSTVMVKYWNIERREKVLSLIIFVVWGTSKVVLSHLQSQISEINSTYLIELVLSNILNFSILLIYLSKIRKDLFVKDKLFRIMAENAKDIIFYFEYAPFPCFTFISPSVETITGYSPNDFYHNPKLYLEICHVDDQKKARLLFDAKKSGIKPKLLRWYSKEGDIIWIEFHNTEIIEDNTVIAMQGIIRDITRRKHAEDSLVQSKKALASFLSYISHELKTPITSILGYISAIQDGTIDSERKKEKAIGLILSKALMLQRLIDDLYQLSQLEMKQFSFKYMQVPALELLERLVEKHAWDIENANLNLKVDLSALVENHFDIIVDTERIEQVFSNVIFNAIKFTPEHGTISVLSDVDHSNNDLLIDIQDTGIGIPEQEYKNIFMKFYRTPGNEPFHGIRGSGLGLAIAQEIIVAHGGTISVKSVVGKGSVFRITLPIYQE